MSFDAATLQHKPNMYCHCPPHSSQSHRDEAEPTQEKLGRRFHQAYGLRPDVPDG